MDVLANKGFAKKLLELQKGKFEFISTHTVQITFLSYFVKLTLEKKKTSEKNYSVH